MGVTVCEPRFAAALGIGGALAHHFQRPLGRPLSGVAIRGRVLRPYLAPVALQFLADHHGVGRPDSLAELRLGDPDRHGVVRRDDDPGVDLGRRRIHVPDSAGRSLRVRSRRGPEAKDEGPLGCGDYRKELATIDAGYLVLEAARYGACASRLAHYRLPSFMM